MEGINVTQVDDKTTLLTAFSNEVVILEYLYEIFNVFLKNKLIRKFGEER